MTVYVVQIWVKTGHEADFIKACEKNHLETRKEPGNLRFDLLQSQENPGIFTLYEVYRNDDAVLAHKETQHYALWRETVEPWMAKKRQGNKFSSCLPRDESHW
ncbi:MAG: antibiotic biosynthesis monooxygenase [Spirochaetaceae bacterium]|jgi:autoinducer 2-degrading protein|nr:antibiotic biosynthesis monooxygenase [Spirochaetaceae bacterium]